MELIFKNMLCKILKPLKMNKHLEKLNKSFILKEQGQLNRNLELKVLVIIKWHQINLKYDNCFYNYKYLK